jgi:hypothetical protein
VTASIGRLGDHGQENSESHLRFRVSAVSGFHLDWKILSPAAKRHGVDMLEQVMGASERFACKTSDDFKSQAAVSSGGAAVG